MSKKGSLWAQLMNFKIMVLSCWVLWRRYEAVCGVKCGVKVFRFDMWWRLMMVMVLPMRLRSGCGGSDGGLRVFR